MIARFADARPWRTDVAIVLLLCAAALATKLPLLPMHRPPFEDAAMVMRYAEHLAQGHGIVWNVGDAPLDGATDFLFLLGLGALRALGVPVETGVRVLGIAAHLLTVAVVYLGNTRVLGVRRGFAALAAFFLAIGPGLHYVAACFATPAFGLLAATTWLLAQRIHRGDDSRAGAYAFAVSGFVMGLVRPEGVFLAAFMLLALVLTGEGRARWKPVLPFVAVFALAGGAYFAWRWNYFGHPLPNPFYKKGGGALYPGSLVISVRNATVLLLPFLPVFAAALLHPRVRREGLFPLVPLVLFTGIWILLSNEMNYLLRFQYAVLPVAMLSWPRLLEDLLAKRSEAAALDDRRRSPLPAGLLGAYLVLATLSPYLLYHVLHREHGSRDGRRDVGLLMREYRDRGYTLATTEAGLLPFYSGWRSIDAWGLNDAWIAKNGGVTREYLDRNRPQVIMIHAWFSPGITPAGSGAWFEMQKVLHDYAEGGDYELAAVHGVHARDTHYYYVERGLPDSEALVRGIRNADYYWYTNDRRTTSYLP